MKLKRCAALLLCGALLLLVLTGCSGRKTPTEAEFTEKAAAAGFTLEDLLSDSLAESSLSTALSYRDPETGTEIDYTVSPDASRMQSLYAQILSQFSGAGLEEKRIDSSEYCRFFAEGNGTVVLLWRNGGTLIFLTGNDSEALRAFIQDLGI